MVAGDRPPAVAYGPSSKAASSESRLNASQVLPVEVSSPASKTAVGAGRVARPRAPRGPCRCCRAGRRPAATTVSPSSRLPELEVGGRVGGVAVEDPALVVGVDRALDQPPGLAAWSRRPGPRRPSSSLGHGDRRGRGTSASDCHSPLAVERAPRRRPRAAHRTTPMTTSDSTQRRPPASAGRGASELAPPVPAHEQPDHDRHQRRAPRRAPRRRRPCRRATSRTSATLALRLAGDERVALAPARRCWRRRSCPARRRAPTRRPRVGPAGRAAPGRCAARRARTRSGRSTASWLASTIVAAAAQEDHEPR